MKPKTIGSKLFIIIATALAITTVCSAEAKHDHGGGGWHGGDQHAAGAGGAIALVHLH